MNGWKKFLNLFFSKLVLGGLMIVLQFGWIVYITYKATLQSSLLNVLLHFLAILLALYLVSRDMRPFFKLSWIFFVLLLPLFGCAAYFLFGRSNLTKRTQKRLMQIANEEDLKCYSYENINEEIRSKSLDAYLQSQYIAKNSGYPIYREQESTYYSCGEEMFPALLKDLRSAKDFIFMEYFIFETGEMMDTIVDILEQKAKEGVHVRLIYDGVGSIGTLPNRYYKVLQAKGIHCACFNPFRPVLSVIMNNRDHRKITVIDGRIAYTGGLNIADEYINKVERFGYWKDAAIRITGEDAVFSFTSMFLEMWSYIVRGTENYKRFRPQPAAIKAPDDAKGYIQPFGDTPLFKEQVSESVYLNLIERAKHYVYIFTPYLIIDSELSTALTKAAKSGVDVRIVTPGIPDKAMVYLLTQAYYPQLIAGGVRIYQYTPGFIHAKCFVVDDEYAVVGTINMDYRSLCLHFECGVFMYHTQSVLAVKEDALRTFAISEEVSLETCRKKNVVVRLIQSILMLFSPLM